MIREKANYISVKDLAELVDVSPKMIYRAIQNGKLSAVKPGKTLRIYKSDALQWLHKNSLIAEDSNETN